MSDNHEDPIGARKPALSKARALYAEFLGSKVRAALLAALAQIGPPRPARAKHSRRVRSAMRGCYAQASNGERECSRRRAQIAKGMLQVSR